MKLKPVLDIGFVIVGIITGVLLGLTPLLDHFMSTTNDLVDFIDNYHYFLAALFFALTIAFLVQRRKTIGCACAGGIPHTHNPWIQTIAAFIIATSIYFLLAKLTTSL